MVFNSPSKRRYVKTHADPIAHPKGSGAIDDELSPKEEPRYKKTNKPPPLPQNEVKKGRLAELIPESVMTVTSKVSNGVKRIMHLPTEIACDLVGAYDSSGMEMDDDSIRDVPCRATNPEQENVAGDSDPGASASSVHQVNDSTGTGAGGTKVGTENETHETVVGKSSVIRNVETSEKPRNNDRQDTQKLGTTRESKSTGKVIMLPPLVEFVLRDASVLVILGGISVAVTYLNFDQISPDGIPLRVAFLWIVLAFLCGHSISDSKLAGMIEEHQREKAAWAKREKEELEEDRLIKRASMELTGSPDDEDRDTICPLHTSKAQTSFERRHTLLLKAMRSVKVTVVPTSPVKASKTLRPRLPEGFHTTLLDDPPNIVLCDFLMSRLLKVPTHTLSKDGKVAVPLCPQRGADVFLTDTPDDVLFKNKLLLRCGLRDQPTFIVNLILPWANVAVYLQMPDWVKKFDDIIVRDDDPEDVKAFKNFLKGDDEYKRLRFQFLPTLKEGPMAMRVLAPPKKEIIGRATMLSTISWLQEDEYVDKFSRKFCAVLEGSLDVTGDRLSRGVAGVMRRYLPTIDMDVVFEIDQPELQKEYEPAACIGFWQLAKIDVENCPVMPEKSEEEMVRDASVAISRVSPVAVAS